jgi:hypothetical protein|tara:strand:+ start:10695 stop:10967 length:273 start_codon:yes stop_codon:yes gene_type:complete
MSNNPFKGVGNNLTGAVLDMLPITPHDTNLFSNDVVAIGLYITVGGAVKFTTAQGNARTVTVPDNFYLICSAKRVFATGTTATGIHALVS